MNTNRLIDPFQRRIAYLRLSVTDFCNYRCVYCLPDGYQACGNPDDLSLSEITTLVQAFSQSGTQKIRLSGGEPTLRRDITDIVRICAAQPNITKVALTTNGHRLEKLYRPLHDAGVDQFNVSIDSFNADTFAKVTGKNALHGILRGVEQMLDYGCHVKLNALLMKDSAATLLDDTLAFVKTRPITMRFIELMRTGDNEALFNQAHISAAGISQRLIQDGWTRRERSPMAGPAQEFTHPDYLGGIGIIAPYSKDFCTTCNRLRVTASGKMHLCLFDSLAYDLRRWLRTADVPGLKAQLQRLLIHKPEHHHLHNNNPGIMRHLSQIGG